MARFRFFLAAVVAVSIFVPLGLAQDDEANSKEMEAKACGPKEKEVDFRAGTDKSGHPTPDQPADKALIYVIRPSMMGNKVQSKLAVDGDWKGVNRGNNYFSFTLEPGEHYFCSAAENHSLLKLKVEAGKTYYLQQHLSMGVMKARTKLEPMTEDEGKKKLAGAHPSTWETK